jgi:hypothetical protein
MFHSGGEVSNSVDVCSPDDMVLQHAIVIARIGASTHVGRAQRSVVLLECLRRAQSFSLCEAVVALSKSG